MTTPNPTDIFPTISNGKVIPASMTYYDIRWNGSDYKFSVGGAQEKTLSILGIHGYATAAEAARHVQTMNALQAAAGGANILAGVVAGPGILQPGNIAQGAGAAGAAAAAVPSGLNAIGAFFTRLGQASLWLRIGEVVLGIVLVAVGASKIVPAFTPAQMIAKRVGVKI